MNKFTSRFGGDIEWMAVTPPDGTAYKGTVQIAHGMAEHKARYLPFMNYLANRGYVSVIGDHRGHGGSVAVSDDLGHLDTDGHIAMIEDMHDLTLIVKADTSLYTAGQPFFLFGHSMGSLAVRSYIKRYEADVDGFVVCGCPSENPTSGIGLALAKAISKIRGARYRSKLLVTLSSGEFNKPFKSEGRQYAWISANTKNVDAYNADQLCGYTFTAGGYVGLIELMRDCYDTSDWYTTKPDMPVLFISGEDDPCMINRAALDKAAEKLRAVGFESVSVQLYPKMRHEILNETDCERVFCDLSNTFDEWRTRIL